MAYRSQVFAPSLFFALLLLIPGKANAQLQVVNTQAESITIGAWFQPVLEYRGVEDAPDVMGSYFRRVRLDVAGSIMEGRVRFRLYPEFAPTVSVRDAWIEYRWGNGMALRMGQQVIPFDLQREKSMGRAHFGERAIAARRFELSGGRDIGATGRWGNSANTRLVTIGLFNATGANRRELGPSPLLSARGVLSFGGPIASGETDLNRTETPILTVAAGLMTAQESLLRPRPGFANEAPTDWTGWTADLHGRWSGFSVVGAWYEQNVSPVSGLAEDTKGRGWILSGGWVLPGSPAEIAVKHSEAEWDREGGAAESETAIGVTVFHRRHEVQTRIQLILEENPILSTGKKATVLTVEHQLLLGG